MPRLNFAEPPHCGAQPHGAASLPFVQGDDIVRLSALRTTTLEVAHDLGNLLQVAGSAIQLIKRNLDGPPAGTLGPVIGAALAAIERATLLSRRILDAGQSRTPAPSTVHPDRLVTKMLGEIALAAGPAVRVVVEAAEPVPAVPCQGPDLENVILNLVVNARDAMPDGGLLTIAVRQTPARSSGLRHRSDVILSVADTGCGMSQAVAAQAFTPFFTTKPRHRGTGLGLAMVGTFAGRLGGAAEIVSSEGSGTTVVLRLPGCDG